MISQTAGWQTRRSTGTSRAKRTLISWRTSVLVVAALALMLAATAYVIAVAREIAEQSLHEESRSADVIVVLGAAEYRGHPSPILRSRLDHALALYRKGFAPYILTTGGRGGDPTYTEGEVGRGYLTQQGIPSESILVEPNGSTTVQSLQAAAEIMQRMNLHSCIVVSDGYHIFRVKRVLERSGIQVYGSPRPEMQTRTAARQRWLYLRQAIGYCLWRAGISV